MFSDFMMGARSRLLPASVPFRFFGTAVVLHVAAWGTLLWAGDAVPGFMGGGGPALAALHLITLGVLAMVAMGASYQLLPVATKRPVRSEAACKLSHGLMAPGVLLLAFGFATLQSWALHGGMLLTVLGAGVFAVMIMDNLRRVDDLPLVTGHAWLAMASLVALLVLGALLAADFNVGFLSNRPSLAAAHAVAGGYGFMGMLAMGFSYVLVPMFSLAQLPRKPFGVWALRLSALALASGFVGALSGLGAFDWLGIASGLVAVGLYLEMMRLTLKSRMRRSLGLSFVLVRVGWAALVVSLVVAAVAAADWRRDITVPLFGFLLIYGFLLTFVMGVLQRIMPFLASMHSYRPGGKAALVSVLTADLPLTIHAVCHFGALLLVAAGIVSEIGWLVRLGATAGLVGAVSFLAFAVALWQRLIAHVKSFPPPSPPLQATELRSP